MESDDFPCFCCALRSLVCTLYNWFIIRMIYTFIAVIDIPAVFSRVLYAVMLLANCYQYHNVWIFVECTVMWWHLGWLHCSPAAVLCLLVFDFDKTPNGVLPYVMTCVRRRSFFVHLSGSFSRTVWPRITIFYADIHTDLLNSHTWYDDFMNYFLSEVVMKKKYLESAASGGFESNFVAWHFARPNPLVGFLSGQTPARMAFLPIAMTSDGCRSFVVVPHKVSGFCNSGTVWPRITKFHKDIHTSLAYSHAGYDISSYFGSADILF